MACSEIIKGHWSSEEDEKLKRNIEENGAGNWMNVPIQAGLNRTGKSCRERWENYLKPGINRGAFSAEEEDAIRRLYSSYPNKWTEIASHFPGRTADQIRNYCNKLLRKRPLPQADILYHPTASQNHHSLVTQPTTKMIRNEGAESLPPFFAAADKGLDLEWINDFLRVDDFDGPQTPASSSATHDDEEVNRWIDVLTTNDDAMMGLSYDDNGNLV